MISAEWYLCPATAAVTRASASPSRLRSEGPAVPLRINASMVSGQSSAYQRAKKLPMLWPYSTTGRPGNR